MIFNKGELRTIFPKNNYVLVRPVIDTNYIQVSKEKLLVDTTYKPENHQPVVCQILATPTSLIYSRKKSVGNSMEWRTNKNIKHNDICIVNYLAMITALKRRRLYCEDYAHAFDSVVYSGSFEIKERNEFVLIPFESIYLVIRDDDVHMCNGYVLVELIEEKKQSSLILQKKINNRMGYIRYLGEPNIEYRDKNQYDDDRVRKDDLVILQHKFQKKLENSLHQVFGNGNEFMVVQRKNIIAILREHNPLLKEKIPYKICI